MMRARLKVFVSDLLNPRFNAETSSTAGGPALYARQRRVGFSRLRFLEPLEREYRNGFAATNTVRVGLLHAVGILSLLGFVVFDRYVADHRLSPLGESLLLVMGLGLLIPVLVANSRWRQSALQVSLTAGLMANYLALVLVVFVTRLEDSGFPYESLLLVSFYTYFMSALPLRNAILCGLVPFGVHAVLTARGLATPPPYWQYELYYLGLANLFGMLGRYIIEYQERALYLLQRERAYDASHDALTGVLNRRAFLAHAQQVWALAARNQMPIGLALYDLDDFKRVNDLHGHAAGDEVLVALTEALSAHARRATDGIGRQGGDEFVGLWSQCAEADFHRIQNQIAERLEGVTWGPRQEQTGISTSTGALWVVDARALSLSEAMMQADRLLYDAKASGKRRIHFSIATH